jgi:hypothetical protein
MTEEQRIRQAINLLGEFFDTVQIFTTRYDSENESTEHWTDGVGNIFARLHQVQRYAKQHDLPNDYSEEEDDGGDE